ncbi:MAG: hypothetical protein WBX27_06625, partial [Specibacter sp.]
MDSARIDEPLTRASRRILANSSTLNSITALHRWKNNPDEINDEVGSVQTAIHRPASHQVGSTQTAEVVSIQTAIIRWVCVLGERCVLFSELPPLWGVAFTPWWWTGFAGSFLVFWCG